MTRDAPIREIHSLKKIDEERESIRAIINAMPLIRPGLKKLGVATDQIDDVIRKFEKIENSANDIMAIPDRFNDLFASRGWIVHELIDPVVAKAAIEKGEAGDIDGAEAVLVDYYNADTIERLLRRMKKVKAFRNRMPLAQKALIDYREERYHACVPVVLALLDGMVNELHEKARGIKRGFFAEYVDLSAWDSISAHEKGLKHLAHVFTATRQRTTTEPITLPYRNGILHGMDLGYDNKMVAAKAWAALFAIRDWSIKAEEGVLDAINSEDPTTWRDLIQKVRENDRVWDGLNNWRPRTINVGRDIPNTGVPDVFHVGEPERLLAEFFCYWKDRNYGYMARCIFPDSRYDAKDMPRIMRKAYDNKHLNSFELKEVIDAAPAITVISAKLVYIEANNKMEKSIDFRMICTNPDGNPELRGMPETRWTILHGDIII